MKHLLILNPENATEDEVTTYAIRKAARAIVIGERNQVALLYVGKHGYYKLPGGGIEGEEQAEVALKRECSEEIGCDIRIDSEIGMITECRKMFRLKQISYCYLVHVTGEKKNPNFTEEETEKGFVAKWLAYTQAREALKNCRTGDKEGSLYIVPRDLTFLEAAGEHFA